jgi:DNA-binding transcriptional MerR regulator
MKAGLIGCCAATTNMDSVMAMQMRDLETATGVNRETIRVYFRHGLLPEPNRPRPNVADYDDDHVRAIMAVRDLQRNNGLTLKQIGNVLSGKSNNRQVEATAFANLETLVATRVGLDDRQVLLSSLLKVWPKAADDAEAFEQMGLISIIRSRKGPALSVTDSRILTIWQEMRAAGYTEENGFPPTIVEFYKEPAETIAAQESGRFLEAVGDRWSADDAAMLFQTGIRLMIDFFGLLRVKALMRNIHFEPSAGQSKPRSAKVKGPPKKAGKPA